MNDPNEGIILQQYPDTQIRKSVPPLPTRGGSPHVVMPDTLRMPSPAEIQQMELRAKELRLAHGHAD